jgi:DNA-binding Xre family transcriptional regulator
MAAGENNVSSWSKKAGKEIGALSGALGIDSKGLAEKAAISPARTTRLLDGKAEFTLAEFVQTANALEYTPGGLLARCLKS